MGGNKQGVGGRRLTKTEQRMMDAIAPKAVHRRPEEVEPHVCSRVVRMVRDAETGDVMRREFRR